MGLALAYLRRDALIWSSYRLAALWQVMGLCLTISVMYFLGILVGDHPSLAGNHPGGYVAFLFSGVAFLDIILQSMYAIPYSIRDNQKSGTLECMMIAPVSVIGLALSSGMFTFFQALMRMVVILGFGFIFIDLWPDMNLGSMLVVLIPAIATFASIGLISGAFIILAKQGDPVLLAYGGLSALFSGVLFPIEILPSWLQPVTAILPLTYALTGLRAALEGAAVGEVVNPALIMAGMTALLLPSGVIAFKWAVNHAKKEGSLVQY